MIRESNPTLFSVCDPDEAPMSVQPNLVDLIRSNKVFLKLAHDLIPEDLDRSKSECFMVLQSSGAQVKFYTNLRHLKEPFSYINLLPGLLGNQEGGKVGYFCLKIRSNTWPVSSFLLCDWLEKRPNNRTHVHCQRPHDRKYREPDCGRGICRKESSRQDRGMTDRKQNCRITFTELLTT